MKTTVLTISKKPSCGFLANSVDSITTHKYDVNNRKTDDLKIEKPKKKVFLRTRIIPVKRNKKNVRASNRGINATS